MKLNVLQPRRFPWRWTRRLVQLLCLAGLAWLFRLTEYRGADQLKAPLNLLFRADPLVAVSAMLAGRVLLLTMWPAAVVLILTLLLGRAFCGWVCPLGTILDATHRVFSPLFSLARYSGRGRGEGSVATGKHAAIDEEPSPYPLPEYRERNKRDKKRAIRYAVLITVLLAACFSLQLVGYVDPFSLLYRAFVQFVDPKFADAVEANTSADLRGTLLPFDQKHYLRAVVPAVILGVILLLELFAHRFWCRYLCPLGGMLGLIGRFAPLTRVPVKECRNCDKVESCVAACRMDAFDLVTGKFQPELCTLCMDCSAGCERCAFGFRRHKPEPPPVDLSRRTTMSALFVGIAVPAVARGMNLTLKPQPDPHLLRPPGVGDKDGRFLDQCVRCGLCLKVCPTNALQTMGLAGGIEGLFSPKLVPRIGYCEVNCNLCSQVCPTGAIPAVAIEDKPKTIIGVAVIDRDRCLPWAKKEECICCEEHCPVADKAIKVRGHWQRPHVDRKLCIGCGICENKCPLEGESAIRVVRLDSAPPETHPGRHGRDGDWG